MDHLDVCDIKASLRSLLKTCETCGGSGLLNNDSDTEYLPCSAGCVNGYQLGDKVSSELARAMYPEPALIYMFLRQIVDAMEAIDVLVHK